MPKVRAEKVETPEGWSRWISPTQPYRFICCDCGLAHDLEFRVMEITEIQDGQAGYFAAPAPREKYRVHFRARRNNRSTAQMRRNRNANR